MPKISRIIRSWSRPNRNWINSFDTLTRQTQFFIKPKIFTPPLSCVCREESPTFTQTIQRTKPVWTCNSCDHHVSLTQNSYLYRKDFSFKTQISLLYGFYLNWDTISVAQDLGICQKTVQKYFRFYRGCIDHFMENHFYPNLMFEVEGGVVYWDESSLGRKWLMNRGIYRQPNWVLGGDQVQTGKLLLKYIPRRTASVMQPIIINHSYYGTTHYTDCHRGYLGLNNHGLFHFNVNHAQGFVNHNNPEFSTNAIEGVWRHLKTFIGKFNGFRLQDINLFLNHFCFCWNYKNESRFWYFLKAISKAQSHVPFYL